MEAINTGVQTTEPTSQPSAGLNNAEPISENISSWEQDKRYSTDWKQDPNALYKSYRNMEKMYSPLHSKVQEYEKSFPELQKFKDENGQIVEYINYLSAHPELSKKLESFVNDINSFVQDSSRQESNGQIGNDPSDRLSRLEQWMHSEQTSFAIKENEKKIHDVVSELQEFSKNEGLAWDDALKDEYLEYCLQNEIYSPKHIKAHFKDFAWNKLKDIYRSKSEAAVISNIQGNKKAAVLPTGNRSIPSKEPIRSNSPAYMEELKAAYRK